MKKEEVLKKFEELGYEIEIDEFYINILLFKNKDIYKVIGVDSKTKKYSCYKIEKFVQKDGRPFFYSSERNITMQEHQLLTELFKCEGWLE